VEFLPAARTLPSGGKFSEMDEQVTFDKEKYEQQRREHYIHEGTHMLSSCWCGHGERAGWGPANPEESHQLVNIGHLQDCPETCNSAHMHIHCRDCVSEGRKVCCLPDNAPVFITDLSPPLAARSSIASSDESRSGSSTSSSLFVLPFA
jgi:hypothetical protein